MGSVVTSSAYMRVSSGCKEYQMIEAVERIVNVLNQVVAEFERRGHVQGCLPACAMVARFIPDAKVINGFAVCDFGAFAHSWVRIDDTHFDVAKEINLRLLPAVLPYTLMESCDGSHRFDRETQDEIRISDEHNRLVKLYEKHPAKFWKQALKWQRMWKPGC